MNLGEAFQRAAARAPDAEAIVDGDRRQTYADWYDTICRTAGGLVARGVRPNDHLAVVMKNRWEMATLAWASYMSGVIFTPINWRSTADEIAYCLEDSDAVLCVYDGSCENAVVQACNDTGLTGDKAIASADAGECFSELMSADPVAGPSSVLDTNTALMLYTSGTTGRPKGVPRSHKAEWSATASQIMLNEYPRMLSQLCVMPLFHTMGMRTLEASALLNGKMVCLPDYSAAAVLDTIEQENIGGIFLVPTMYHDILNQPDIAQRNVSSVIRSGFAGMTMAPSLVEKCCNTFGDNFLNFYGSSEIYTFAASNRQREKPAAAGKPGLYQEIRIVTGDPDRRIMPDETVPKGNVGEIIVNLNSPDAFAGYWKRPDADEKAIRQGWYYTGDLGRVDEDGDVWVLGRVDDMIISGGENINPEEVEDALLRTNLCHSAVVVGLPDDRMGQRVTAFVEPRVGASAGILDDLLKKSVLANFKRPRAYAFVETIPRTASGKILRRKLRNGEYTLMAGYESTV